MHNHFPYTNTHVILQKKKKKSKKTNTDVLCTLQLAKYYFCFVF